MKLSEVYKTKKWCQVEISRDGGNSCCLIGAIGLANNIDLYSGNLLKLVSDLEMTKRISKMIVEKFPKFTQEPDHDILRPIWRFNDTRKDLQEVLDLIDEYTNTYEKEN